MKFTGVFVVALLCGISSACGSGSSGSPSGSLTVSPASASVVAGSTQLYAVTDGNGDTITWQVNGITGGNTNVGTISSGGLYTAPDVPPTSQPVSITAMQDSNTGSAAATVTYSNKSLNGQFVFTFNELRGGIPTNVIGLITADGNGNISGTEDVNGPIILPPSISVTGNYTLSANGQGTLTLSGGVSLSLTLTLVAGATEGILTDDAPLRVGGGSLFPVTGSSNSTNVSGNYTIELGAASVASNDNSVGVLSLSSPSINSGYIDRNNSGNYLQYNTVSGGYTVGIGNRGTLSLSVDGGNTFTNYVFYAVSPNQLELMCTDTGCMNTGEMYTQTSQTIAAGNYVFQLIGSGTGTTPDALLLAATITPSSSTGGAISYTLYENFNGFYQQPITGNTTYTIPSLGRGTMTIGPRSFVFYMQSAGYLYLLETSSGSGNTSGFASMTQSQPSAVPGQYVLLTLGQAPNSTSISTIQATLKVASSGQLTGEGVQNASGTLSTLSVSGSLAAQSTGIYNMMLNLGGGQTASFVAAPVAPGVLLPIGIDTNQVRVGGFYYQYQAQ